MVNNLIQEINNVKLSMYVDKYLLGKYKSGGLKKIGKPIELKVGKDNWKMQCVDKDETVVTYIAIRCIVREEETMTGSLGSYRKKIEKNIRTYPVRQVYCGVGDSLNQIKEALILQLGYVKCSGCDKLIFGDEPRLEDKRWWCKNCHNINYN